MHDDYYYIKYWKGSSCFLGHGQGMYLVQVPSMDLTVSHSPRDLTPSRTSLNPECSPRPAGKVNRPDDVVTSLDATPIGEEMHDLGNNTAL